MSILSLFTAGSVAPLEVSASLPRSLISSEKEASGGKGRGGGGVLEEKPLATVKPDNVRQELKNQCAAEFRATIQNFSPQYLGL